MLPPGSVPVSDADSWIPAPPRRPPETLPKIFHPLYEIYFWALATRRRRTFWYNSLRAAMVLGMLGLVTAIVIPELTNTAEPAPDPLTIPGLTITIAPENTTGVSGLVDGDDVVAGNFTVTSPAGTPVLFNVLPPGNGTWGDRLNQSIYALPEPMSAYTFAFTAAYTDWYFFVWTNPSNETVSIYLNSNYLSSAPPA
jgi:hypothetical protein